MMWIEGWYVSYALLGASAAGILPILLPIIVSGSSTASQVGLVMAAFSFGGLTAPLWGKLADARRLHTALLSGGLAFTAFACAAFMFFSAPFARIVLALFQGIGIAAASTTANLFIVEAHPRSEWDARIGWLQTFYGGGQVAGLLLAGILAQADSLIGLMVAAGLVAVAVFPALLATPRLPEHTGQQRPALTHPARHAEWPATSPQRMYHHLTGRANFRLLSLSGDASFPLFLLGWFLSFAGSAAFFSLFPIVMQHAYGVGPALSSAGFAVSAGLGLLLYAPAGRWSQGKPLRVLRWGLGARLAAYSAIALLFFVERSLSGFLALGLFLVVVLAWSALSVAGTAVVAEMFSSRASEGEGLGLFNAVTAFAGVAGSVAGGWTAAAWSYGSVPIVALVGTAAGLAVLLAGKFERGDLA
ncbi:MAG TPA: MFS transporter [Spirochaetia bacterium]|nr:MFS transporter [Spirochaetia bacterium]